MAGDVSSDGEGKGAGLEGGGGGDAAWSSALRGDIDDSDLECARAASGEGGCNDGDGDGCKDGDGDGCKDGDGAASACFCMLGLRRWTEIDPAEPEGRSWRGGVRVSEEDCDCLGEIGGPGE
jgi:hypothetical protein